MTRSSARGQGRGQHPGGLVQQREGLCVPLADADGAKVDLSGSETISSVPSPSKVTCSRTRPCSSPRRLPGRRDPARHFVSNFLSLFGIIVHVTWTSHFPSRSQTGLHAEDALGLVRDGPREPDGNPAGVLDSIFRWLSAPTQVGLKYRSFRDHAGNVPACGQVELDSAPRRVVEQQRSDSLYTLAS